MKKEKKEKIEKVEKVEKKEKVSKEEKKRLKEEAKKQKLEEKQIYKSLTSKEEKKKFKKEHAKKSGMIYFFKQVINELKITVWPDKYYMIKYSIATFATIILCSVYFSLIYLLFTYIKELR